MIRLNQQTPEKQHLRGDGVLDVVEVFYTIQGEGPYVGRPAVFVRLAGCNLTCPVCDTDYTSRRQMVEPDALADLVYKTYQVETAKVGKVVLPLVVITGGEPFRQDIGQFVRILKHEDYDFQVETNGTLFLEDFPWLAVSVVCSPKAPEVNKNLRPHVHALKYVVETDKVSESDGLPLSVLGKDVPPARPWPSFQGEIFVQPADAQDETINKANLKAAIRSCKRFGYRLSVQVHKIAGLP